MAEVLGPPFDLARDLPQVRNLLVVHGEADPVVPVAHAREIHAAAAEPKRIVLQPGGDHLMSDPRHQEEFMRAALRWLTARDVTGSDAVQSRSTGTPSMKTARTVPARHGISSGSAACSAKVAGRPTASSPLPPPTSSAA